MTPSADRDKAFSCRRHSFDAIPRQEPLIRHVSFELLVSLDAHDKSAAPRRKVRQPAEARRSFTCQKPRLSSFPGRGRAGRRGYGFSEGVDHGRRSSFQGSTCIFVSQGCSRMRLPLSQPRIVLWQVFLRTVIRDPGRSPSSRSRWAEGACRERRSISTVFPSATSLRVHMFFAPFIDISLKIDKAGKRTFLCRLVEGCINIEVVTCLEPEPR